MYPVSPRSGLPKNSNGHGALVTIWRYMTARLFFTFWKSPAEVSSPVYARSITYPLRWAWLRNLSYSDDDSSSVSNISGKTMPCGLSQFQYGNVNVGSSSMVWQILSKKEEEPVEVDLIGLAGELISAIAVSAVDLSLIVEVSLISAVKILHSLNGGLELLHVLVVYGVSGRPDIKRGETGDLIVLNPTSIRDGRATRVRHFIIAERHCSRAAVGNVRDGRREAVRVFTPLRRGCAPDLDVTTTSCTCPAGVEKDLGRSGKVTGRRRLGGQGNVVGA
nr:hypothetical protein Iba_chr13aCG2760 [Ipomoea batatas]